LSRCGFSIRVRCRLPVCACSTLAPAFERATVGPCRWSIRYLGRARRATVFLHA
jgi:hypothetical protein